MPERLSYINQIYFKIDKYLFQRKMYNISVLKHYYKKQKTKKNNFNI